MIVLASAVITGFQSDSMPVTIPDTHEHSRSSGDNAYRRKSNFHFLRQREFRRHQLAMQTVCFFGIDI